MVRRAEDRLGEHGIGQRGPGDGPGDLAGHHGSGQAEAVAARDAAAEQPVGGGDDRVEVRPAGLDEHHDQHGQAERGHHRVDQQPQRAPSVVSRVAAIPDPTTTATSTPVPVNSASSRLPTAAVMRSRA
jgi:hypothetical protein